MKLIAMTALALSLCACSQFEQQPKVAEDIGLDRHYTMHDRQGAYAGTVVLRPVGNGEVRDAQGRLVGRIISPN